MSNFELVVHILGLLVVASPAMMVIVLGVASLLGRPLGESKIDRYGKTAITTGLVSALLILTLFLWTGRSHVAIELGNWVHIGDEPPVKKLETNDSTQISVPETDPPTGTVFTESHEGHYHFVVEIVFDRLSVPFVILTFLLCGTIGAFANKYMHREPGFNRFFVFYSLFVLGMIVTSVAGTIETLFAGWELVGLSSALLVAFYHERLNPVRNGLWVWCVYRISDAALLIAAVILHHISGEGDFEKLMGEDAWPHGVAAMSQWEAFSVGMLLLLAAMGKSAMFPFSGWLPRAMEGPTPSSAVFYGALSVHLGAYLLLRVSPILDLSIWLCLVVFLVGAGSATFASFAGRVQTDVKSALSFASETQVGIIIAEIGLFSMISHFTPGVVTPLDSFLRYFVLIHILGHACFRTLQFVRAPNALHDRHLLENALGERLPRGTDQVREKFYRFAIERGYIDALMLDYLVNPFLSFFRACDNLERRWTTWLAGGPSNEPEGGQQSLEDVL